MLNYALRYSMLCIKISLKNIELKKKSAQGINSPKVKKLNHDLSLSFGLISSFFYCVSKYYYNNDIPLLLFQSFLRNSTIKSQSSLTKIIQNFEKYSLLLPTNSILIKIYTQIVIYHKRDILIVKHLFYMMILLKTMNLHKQ